MKTGFTELDKIVNIGPGDLVIVGGRPSMGKSAFLRKIAINQQMCKESPVKTVICDFQSRPQETLLNILCTFAGVERQKIGNIKDFDNVLAEIEQQQIAYQESYSKNPEMCSLQGSINGVEFQQLVAAVLHMQHWNLEVTGDDESEFIEWLDSAETLPDIFILDYLQLAALSYSPGLEMASILKKLKHKAVKSGTIVFVATQISQKVVNRTGCRPMLLDLSETSAQEEIADKILLLLRREVYDLLEKPGIVEMIVGKNKNGPVRSVNLEFRKETMDLCDYAPMPLDLNMADDYDFASFFQEEKAEDE